MFCNPRGQIVSPSTIFKIKLHIFKISLTVLFLILAQW